MKAQFNKLANFFWKVDPIAQMQLEYDTAVEELKQGRLDCAVLARRDRASQRLGLEQRPALAIPSRDHGREQDARRDDDDERDPAVTSRDRPQAQP